MNEPPPRSFSVDPSRSLETVRPLRILLVEDSEDNALVFKLYLKDLPFEVVEATDGGVGVERFQEGGFDLVIMDIQMPVMDGYEATRRIRGLEAELARDRVPILALTAHASEENEARVMEAGCDGYLTKPIPKARLLEAIGAATGCFSG